VRRGSRAGGEGGALEASQARNLLGMGDVYPSHLDDLLPEDIARVDVLRGPAASARYGPGAAGGAVRLTERGGA
jgi:outer membrane receptor protein involved in Fe transport